MLYSAAYKTLNGYDILPWVPLDTSFWFLQHS